jgi:cyclopropane fatty-acyl-phospholipid synthase-like methyltransferase
MSTFEMAYRGGQPPWDVAKPQQSFVCLEEIGEIKGAVLDVGCGTGENALFLASQGHEVWGVDLAPTAVARAQRKAAQRGLAATFRVADGLQLEELGRQFDTVIDSGLFHSLSDRERPLYVHSLRQALRLGGRYFLLCFNEHDHGPGGPRRVTQQEIRDAFAGDGWQVRRIDPARFEATYGEAQAWLATIVRRGEQTKPEPSNHRDE